MVQNNVTASHLSPHLKGVLAPEHTSQQLGGARQGHQGSKWAHYDDVYQVVPSSAAARSTGTDARISIVQTTDHESDRCEGSIPAASPTKECQGVGHSST
jgi:hypothetical protein